MAIDRKALPPIPPHSFQIPRKPVRGIEEVQKTETASSTATATPLVGDKAPSPPPDGGLQAWLQVLGCFFCWFNSWYATIDFRCSLQANGEIGESPTRSESSKPITKMNFCGTTLPPKYPGLGRSNLSC